MVKKITAFALAAACVFCTVGCQSGDEHKTAVSMGRYVEQETIIYSDVFKLGELYMRDGKPGFIDLYEKRIYTERVGENTFAFYDMPSLSELGDNPAIFSAVCAENGDLFLLYWDSTAGQGTLCGCITADGKVKRINVDIGYICDIACSADGRLFALNDSGKIYEIDAVSDKAKELCDSSVSSSSSPKLDVVGDYIVAANGKTLFFYDYKNGKEIETPEAIQSFWSANISEGHAFDFCSGEEGAFYIVCKNGLYRYVMNGNQVEQLIDGLTCRLGNPSYTVNSVLCDGDTFLIAYDKSGSGSAESVVMRYAYDPEADNDLSSTLKIYSLTENPTLLQAISDYKTQNPIVRVDYEAGMRDGMTYDDAVKNLTTEILSGSAPDVIMLDGMDIDNYISKNMLLDLSDSESVWNPDHALLDNVAKWNDDGGLYSVACKFGIPALIAESDVLERTDSLTALAEETEKYNQENADILVIDILTARDVLERILLYVGDDVIDENGINSAELQQMLEDCKKIYDNTLGQYLYMGSEVAAQAEQEYIKRKNDPMIYNAGYYSRGFWLAPSHYLYGMGLVNGFFNCLNDLTSVNIDDEYDIGYRYGLTEDSHTFLPVCNLGICTAGANAEEAEKFLAVALSEEVQEVELYDGLPVNTKTLQKYYDRNKDPNDYVITQTTNIYDEWITYRTEWMSNAEVEEFRQTIEALDAPVLLDTMTQEIIIDYGTQCLNGKISAEEAVEEISEQLSLRMKE